MKEQTKLLKKEKNASNPTMKSHTFRKRAIKAIRRVQCKANYDYHNLDQKRRDRAYFFTAGQDTADFINI